MQSTALRVMPIFAKRCCHLTLYFSFKIPYISLMANGRLYIKLEYVCACVSVCDCICVWMCMCVSVCDVHGLNLFTNKQNLL